MARRNGVPTPRDSGTVDAREIVSTMKGPITAQMLVEALQGSEDAQGGQFLDATDLDGVCIDGWYDLETTAVLLNEHLGLTGARRMTGKLRQWPRRIGRTTVFVSTRWLHIALHGDYLGYWNVQRPNRFHVLAFCLAGLEISLPSIYGRRDP